MQHVIGQFLFLKVYLEFRNCPKLSKNTLSNLDFLLDFFFITLFYAVLESDK